MGKDVIVACDFASAEETLAFLDKFTDEKPYVKIGMELFYAEGPQIVRQIKQRGHKIFLDLKLHDIPNTVKKAMKVLSGLDVDMCNLHAGGTIAMMEVGAMMVGKITNLKPGACEVKKGEEKGYFEFGGSTIVLLLQHGKVRLDSDLIENSENGYETIVRMGERIGKCKLPKRA